MKHLLAAFLIFLFTPVYGVDLSVAVEPIGTAQPSPAVGQTTSLRVTATLDPQGDELTDDHNYYFGMFVISNGAVVVTSSTVECENQISPLAIDRYLYVCAVSAAGLPSDQPSQQSMVVAITPVVEDNLEYRGLQYQAIVNAPFTEANDENNRITNTLYPTESILPEASVQLIEGRSVNSIQSVDIDGNGYDDLIFALENAPPEIVFNSGNAQFSDPVALPGSALAHVVAILPVDLDNDNLLDLLLVHDSYQLGTTSVAAGVRHYELNQQNEFVTMTGSVSIYDQSVQHAAIADVNHDGAPDLVLANKGENKILLNIDGKIIQSATNDFSLDGDRDSRKVILNDINNNGRTDIFFVNSQGGSRVWFANSGSTLAEIFTTAQSLQLSQPNELDAALVTNGQIRTVVLYANSDNPYVRSGLVINGLGQNNLFSSTAGLGLGDDATQLVVNDFNSDGFDDYFVMHQQGHGRIFYRESTSGLTLSATEITFPADAYVHWADLDNDGYPEAVSAASSGAAVYLNPNNVPNDLIAPQPQSSNSGGGYLHLLMLLMLALLIPWQIRRNGS